MGDNRKTIQHPSRRHRALRWLVLVGFAVVLILSVTVRVRSGEVSLLISPWRDSAVLAPGIHFRVPLVERVEPSTSLSRSGALLRYMSSVGSTIDLQVSYELRLTTEGARRLLEESGPDSSNETLAQTVDRIVTTTIARVSGGAAIPELDERMQEQVRGELLGYGSLERPLELDWSEESPVLVATREAQAREGLRAMTRDTGVTILVVGLDGADWQIAEPLIEQGKLPHLARLRDRGAWGNVKATSPILSPLLWTSVATGVTPDRHGILDFLVKDPATGQRAPVNSRFRKVRALWNVLSDAGRTSDVVAWWATWPAEQIDGHLVSDRVSYSLWDFDMPAGGSGATWPESYFDEIRDELIDDRSILFEDVARFAEVTREEFDSARAQIERDRETAYRLPINHLAKILAATRNYHRIALDLLRRGGADVTLAYYQGIDEVGHRFMHYTAPRMDHIAEADVRRYAGVIERFYVWQDELLGELLTAAGPHTTTIVLSDHGFLNGPDRPAGQTADIEGQPGRWHRRYGVMLLAGPPIEPGRLDTTSLLDVAPTVLHLVGLPVADDLDGRVLTEALSPRFRDRFPEVRMPTYESTPFRPHRATSGEAIAAVEAEMLENLRSLGYVGGVEPATDTNALASKRETDADAVAAAASGETVTAHTNLASVLLGQGDLVGAEREIQAALAIAPGFRTARMQLFDLRARQQLYDEALRVAEGLIEEPGEIDSVFLARVARIYESAGRAEDALARFRTGFDAGRPGFGVVLARLLLETGDGSGAEGVARAVLERDPMDPAAMAVVVRVAQPRGALATVEPLARRALAINPRSVMHLNWMAIARESAGDMPDAERYLRLALEADPDHGGTMANLGAFYGRHGRSADAIPLLERALSIQETNIEARVNLGSAYARTGRLRDAIEQFERIVNDGLENPGIYNALARAYSELGDGETATVWLRRSLELDPRQDEVRRRLEERDRGS